MRARSKSIAIYEDMIYFAAPDGFMVALDAQTGNVRWETKVDNGGQTAGGVIVADAKVISNRTCHQAKRENCSIPAPHPTPPPALCHLHVPPPPAHPAP